jgi:hypothetical protein
MLDAKAAEIPTRLKPGWILITGNFIKAKKKNHPEAKAMRWNLAP